MHQISFGGRPPPRPAGGAYSALPDSLAGLRGPTSKGRGEEEIVGEKKGEGRGKERQMREGKVKGGRKGGGERKGRWCPHMTCLHDAPDPLPALKDNRTTGQL